MEAESELSLAALKLLAALKRSYGAVFSVDDLMRVKVRLKVSQSVDILKLVGELVATGYFEHFPGRELAYRRTFKQYTRSHQLRQHALAQAIRRPAKVTVRPKKDLPTMFAHMLGYPIKTLTVPVGRVHLMEGDSE